MLRRSLATSLLLASTASLAHADLIDVADFQLARPGSEGFGQDIALDGSRIIVGEFAGATIYERGASDWTEVARLDPSTPLNPAYGRSVEIAGDQAFVASLGLGDGKVFVFEKIGASWIETQIIDTHDPNVGSLADQFGFDISYDDATGLLAIGSLYDDTATADGGAVQIFERISGAWTWLETVVSPASPGNYVFGGAIVLENDRLIVGEPGPIGSVGRVHVFERVGGSFVFQQTLMPMNPGVPPYTDPTTFGHTLALSGDTIAVAAPQPIPVSAKGAIIVFEKGPSGWTQVDYLVPAITKLPSSAGGGVAIAGDQIVVGDGVSQAVSVFTRDPWGNWNERSMIQASGVGNHMGYAEKLAFDGQTLVAGSWRSSGLPGDDYGTVNVHENVDDTRFGGSYCAGDVIVGTCPCGWVAIRTDGPGCRNSTGRGALLIGRGSPSLSGPGLAMTGLHLVPNAPCVIFSGTQATGSPIPFGNGLLCIAPPARRRAIKPTGPAGGVAFGPADGLLAGSTPGSVEHYQIWYRDPTAICGGGFNLSNGFRVTVEP